jgi:hypothetical protein
MSLKPQKLKTQNVKGLCARVRSPSRPGAHTLPAVMTLRVFGNEMVNLWYERDNAWNG